MNRSAISSWPFPVSIGCFPPRFPTLLLLACCLLAGALRLRAADSTAAWSAQDIGNVAAAGSSSETAGVTTVNGSGEDIWGPADEFHFRYRQWTGDGIFVVRVTSVENTNTWAKAGLMLRQDLTPSAPYVFASVNPGGTAALFARPSNGGALIFNPANKYGEAGMPMWLRLVRSGVTITASFSHDGVAWQSLGGTQFGSTPTLYLGIAVTSHADGDLCTATFDQLALRENTPAPLAAFARSDQRVDVQWSDLAYDDTGVELERAAAGDLNFTALVTLPAHTTSYVDTTVASRTTYRYRARQVFADRSPSPYSNIAQVDVPSPPPPPWAMLDIGEPGRPGFSQGTSTSLTVSGSGLGIGGVNYHHVSAGKGDLDYTVIGYSDSFQFTYQTLAGDGDIVAHVRAGSTGTTDEVGLMLRQSLDARDLSASIYLRPDGTLHVTSHSSNYYFGGTLSQYDGPTGPNPWLRLRRAGATITAEESTDGANWTVRATFQLSMTETIQAGLAVSSANNATVATGLYDSAAVHASGLAPLPAPSGLAASDGGSNSVHFTWVDNSTDETGFELQSSTDGGASYAVISSRGANTTEAYDFFPSGTGTSYYKVRAVRNGTFSGFSNVVTWTPTPQNAAPFADVDIGAVGAAGSGTQSGASASINGAGADIWGNADSFNFLHRPSTGDGDFIVRVTGLSFTDGWAKAGLMLRDGLAPDARYVGIFVNANGNVTVQSRSAAGGVTTANVDYGPTGFPRWLRVTRSGDLFRLSHSSDGAQWTSLPAVTLTLPGTLEFGYAVTSHHAGTLATATFDQANFTGTNPPPPPPPPPPPTAPSNVAATATSSSAIMVTWQDNAGTENRFDIEYSTNGTTFTSAGTAPTNATSFIHTGLQPATTYWYRVRAALDSVTSPWGNTASATTSAAPPVTSASTDIGPVGAAGSSSFDSGSGTYTVNGSGADIWGTADSFHFFHRAAGGDGDFIVRVTGLTLTDGWAKAGLMLRDSLAPDARYAAVLVSANGYPTVQWRDTTGGTTSSVIDWQATFPRWLRLTRTGNTFQAYDSLDGTNWLTLGAAMTIVLPGSVEFGLAVTSHRAGTLATGTFDHANFTLTGQSPPPPPPPPPPPGAPAAPSGLLATATSSASIDLTWQDNSSDESGFEVQYSTDGTNFTFLQINDANDTTLTHNGLTANTAYSYRVRTRRGPDVSAFTSVATATTRDSSNLIDADIGPVGATGSHSRDPATGIYTVRGSGADIWGASDAFHFAYQAWSGDGEFRVRVRSLSNTDTWAKAGIMLRDGLGAGARYVALLANPGGNAALQYRFTTNNSSTFNIGVYEYQPMWLRLRRTGTNFEAAQSANGTDWTVFWSGTLDLPDSLFLGLAVTSHNAGVVATAEFDNINFTVPTSPPPPPPPTTVAAPDNLAATATSSSAISLTWQDHATDETGFEVQYSVDNTNFVLAGTTAANVTSFVDDDLPPAKTYWYRVRALRNTASSNYSNVATATTLAASWTGADVGNVGLAGSEAISDNGNNMQIDAAGADIWGNADAFRFLYVRRSGDFTFTTRLASLSGPDAWTKAGVMARESLGAGAVNAFVFATTSQGMNSQIRGTTNGSTTFTRGTWTTSLPSWLRLVRQGNIFTSYGSTDGTNWTFISQQTVTMATNDIYVGFAVTAHSTATRATTVFRDPALSP